MDKIAIIILNYNSSSDCRKCISSLLCQKGIDFEIIVVDNCSQASDHENLEKICKEFGATFLQSSENRGYNAGNNLGLRYARSKDYKYAFISNPDMEYPDEKYLASLLNVMKSDDKIVACSSDIITIDGIHQNPMMSDGNWTTAFGWMADFFRSKPKTQEAYDFIDNHAVSHYCDKLSGCCLMIDLGFLSDIDYFDENVFLYCEEAIFAKQVSSRNQKMYYVAEVKAIHAHKENEKGSKTKRFRAWNKSRIYYIKNYSGYPWYGKAIAILSRYLYTLAFISYTKIKHLRRLRG